MKICVMGSSHVGCLKLAWDEMSGDFPEIDLKFFAAPGGRLRRMAVKNGKLVPLNVELESALRLTSGGETEIEPDAYDRLLVVGMNFKMPRLRRGISAAVRRAIMEEKGRKGLTPIFLERLRSLTNKQIWVAPNPLEIATDGDTEDGPFLPYHILLEEMGIGLAVSDVRMVAQPEETILPDLRCPAQYGIGSVRLLPDEDGDDRAHPDGEVKHMNAAYGRLWLERNLPVILAG